jgi:hypothetical protein
LATPTQAPRQALVPRWLVVAVIVMGLLLLVGTIVVGTEVSRRLSNAKAPGPPAAEATSLSTAGRFTQRIELPAGAQVISMTAVGDRLVVQVENQNGLTSAYVVDPRTGALLGTIDFPPPGAPR